MLRDTSIGLASAWRFPRHTHRSKPLIDELVVSGRRSAPVLAILIVETFYRPRLLRLCEYMAWVLLSRVRPARVARMSIGVAQVQLRHWEALGMLDGIRFSRERLSVVRDLARNYEVCERYLASRGVLERSDGPTVTKAYVGAVRPRYLDFFTQARAAITEPSRR